MTAFVLMVKEGHSELTFKLKCNDKGETMRGNALQVKSLCNGK